MDIVSMQSFQQWQKDGKEMGATHAMAGDSRDLSGAVNVGTEWYVLNPFSAGTIFKR